MSDLAPFVAAVLRDKTMADLQQELEAEKEKNKMLQQELRVIRVTGPGGFPVYAERHFQYHVKREEHHLALDLQNSTASETVKANPNLATCPIQELERCELHIGGKEIIVLGSFDNCDCMSIMGESNCSLLYMFHQREDLWHKVCLSVDFGPNPYPDSTHNDDPANYQNEDIEYVRFTDVETFGNPFDDASRYNTNL